MAYKIHIFCVSHKPPIFSCENEFTLVSPVKLQDEKNIVISDTAFGPLFNGNIISEYAQLFMLAKILDQSKDDDFLYLFQYRKFISTKFSGQQSNNVPYARVCPPCLAGSLMPTPKDLYDLDIDLMMGKPLITDSIARQYARNHHIEDFCEMIYILGKIGFSSESISEYIHSSILHPAPANCFIRVHDFKFQMNFLMKFWKLYSQSFTKTRIGTQRRYGGFLLERLHSFLIQKKIENLSKNRFRLGQLIVVNDSLNIAADPSGKYL